MVTTLDMPESPCLAPPVQPEAERTTISPMAYKGFWAASVTWEEVVEVDRIAANPINHRDPTGLTDPDLHPFFKPDGTPRDPIDVYRELASHRP
jgi:hypothetical protein